MKKTALPAILVFAGGAVVIAVIILLAINGYKKSIKTMTAQTVPTITHTAEVRTARYDSNDEREPDEVDYNVTFTYAVNSKQYTALSSISQDRYDSHFLQRAKVCYDPSNPSRSALAPSSFVCGTTALGASIADPQD